MPDSNKRIPIRWLLKRNFRNKESDDKEDYCDKKNLVIKKKRLHGIPNTNQGRIYFDSSTEYYLSHEDDTKTTKEH